MIFSPYKIHPLFKKMFPDFIYNTVNNKILLTFDDGPEPGVTDIVLKTLDERKIKSLFFCLGKKAEFNKSLVEEIISEGHTIGNHTYNHDQFIFNKKNDLRVSIEKTNRIFFENYGIRVEYFRPPKLLVDFRTQPLTENLNLKTVMGSLLTGDWKGDLDIVQKNINDFLCCNSIVILHDSLLTKNIIKESIDILTDTITRNNLSIGEPSECLN